MPENKNSTRLNISHLAFLCLTLIAGVILLLPTINYQPILAQGDHGRDLYAFERTLHGDKIYRDYWWVYGPLMPHYYSLFDKLFGVQISSILVGKNILILTGGLLVYQILALFIAPALAFVGGAWFYLFHEDFFFTYNHIGGIIAILAATYATFLYIKQQKLRYLFFALFCVFLLSLIKINFAVTTLISVVFIAVAAARYSQKKLPLSFFITGLVIIPAVTAAVYYFHLHGLTFYEIRQCFPYYGDDQPHHTPPWQAASILVKSIWQNIFSSKANAFFSLLVTLSVAFSAFLFRRKSSSENWRRDAALAVGFLIFSYLINLHEFLVSGVYYRSFWSKPFTTIMIFLAIGWTAARLSKNIRILLMVTLMATVGLQMQDRVRAVTAAQKPWNYLNHPRGKIYLGNDPLWISTVLETTAFLEKNLQPEETFFALPYDTLYHYLTGRQSPTRQLIIFEHIKIPPEQERKIIAELEEKKINWALLSSRARASEIGLGYLGETYCPLIADYLMKNFEPAAQFGDWANEPGWAWNHGTRILRRK